MGVNSSAQAVISNCLHEMEKRADGAISIQKDMENLLKVIGEAIPDDGGAEEEDDDNSVDQYSYDYGEEFDRPTLNNVTSTMNDTKSVAIRDLSIFGAEGQLLYQDIVDGDLTEHDVATILPGLADLRLDATLPVKSLLRSVLEWSRTFATSADC